MKMYQLTSCVGVSTGAAVVQGNRPQPGQPTQQQKDDGAEVYLLKVARSKGGHLVATSLSDYTVRVYQHDAGGDNLCCSVRAHEGPVTDVLFPFHQGSLVNIMMTASEDGSVKTWDLSNAQQARCINTVVCDGRRSPVWSISVSNSGELLAASSQHGVLIWKKAGTTVDTSGLNSFKWKKIVALEESFCDIVTQVLFHPYHYSSLGSQEPLVLTACGEDGLVCVFDLNKGTDEDDNLLGVLNVGRSIASVGFFGEMHGQKECNFLWCRTNDETFQVWNWTNQGLLVAGSRQHFSIKVDYFLDCHWDVHQYELNLVVGTNEGSIFIFALDDTQNLQQPQPRLKGALNGGHQGVVRWIESSSAPSDYLTCGEDGKLCSWRPQTKEEAARGGHHQQHHQHHQQQQQHGLASRAQGNSMRNARRFKPY
eukprot:CAMPEP_0197469754 /NCGR_PEP_ID=MMETSP1309-20131121/225_1 /TAXON_ID=464262 /ORGANISM="Genus nov. species nov., Strain RCC998" /LENGTH=423 /DNA_ID=CAMNT_0043006015 /DNA_START=36 /DNA_END=1307 /DNA_ORIENTATION=-